MRKIFAHIFTLGEPHCFHLPPAYLLLKDIWSVLSDHDVALQTAMVSANQIMEWLVGESDFEVKCKCFIDDRLDEEHYRALYGLWCEFSIPVREVDFLWRAALGGLQTGDFVRKYKIPGTKVGCMFCDCVLEMTEHLFTECPGLIDVRDVLVEFVSRVVATVDRGDAQSLKELLCLGLSQIEEGKEIQRRVFRLVDATNSIVWSRRNQLLFVGQAGGSLAPVVRQKCKMLSDSFLLSKSLETDDTST